MLCTDIFVLLQFFKESLKFLFPVKEIESYVQKQNTSHNQSLILWFVWYEFSSDRKVLLCWPKCHLIHIRWATPAYLLNTELMKKRVRKVFLISRIKIETVSKDLLACYFTERLHKTCSKWDRNRRKNIGWVAKKIQPWHILVQCEKIKKQ